MSCIYSFTIAPEIRRRRDVGAGLVLVTQAEPPASDVGFAGRGIDGEVDGGCQIDAAVEFMLRMKGQFGEIGVLAFEDDVLHRRILCLDLDHRLGIGQPSFNFVVDLILGYAERRDHAAAAAIDAAHQLHLFGPGIAK